MLGMDKNQFELISGICRHTNATMSEWDSKIRRHTDVGIIARYVVEIR
jgi:hypothetical protein